VLFLGDAIKDDDIQERGVNPLVNSTRKTDSRKSPNSTALLIFNKPKEIA
jgi:hypothetical protein